MVKIEFFLKARSKREAVRRFYESLGLSSQSQRGYLRIKSTNQTKIVSVAQTRICLSAQNHKEILEKHQDLLYDLETERLEEDVETDHAHRSHHIPFKIKITDPIGNSVCITPALEPKTVGILTSGGDAPGMNSAIWAMVKAAQKNGAKTLGIFNGYEGLIKEEIREITEEEAASHMHEGGTFLRSARSAAFTTPEGLAQAIATIKQKKIDAIVVIGGDGSMKGAGYLSKAYPELSVVFIPGSIDNDIPNTESLGAATALHRIIEAVDCIESTMTSHRRGFVLEVMGRDCGWLGLSAAFATDASYVFVPEYAQDAGWKETFQKTVRKRDKKCTYAILSEGARHISGEKLKADEICEALQEIGIDSRKVVLGHTQRGGAPCAADRLIAPTLGVAAAEVALSKPGAYAIFINTTEKVLNLHTCIEQLESLRRSPMDVAKLRGKEFVEMYNAMKMVEIKEAEETYCVAAVGALGAGSDTLISNLKKYGDYLGKKIENITENGYFQKRNLKTKPTEAELLSMKAYLASRSCTSLVLIGGLDALNEAKRLSQTVKSVYVLPCTVTNNIPGTSSSIGSDTALDTITALCDNLKIGASRNVAYIVEVHGSACGYLSIATALATGALDCYFPEETKVLKRLSRSVRALDKYFKRYALPQLIIRGNGAMKGVCIETAARILEEDGNGAYIVRQCCLGHVQKGNRPTAVDRTRAAQMALYLMKSAPKGSYVVGVHNWTPKALSIDEAFLELNEEKRRLKKATWLEMARTYRVLN